MQEIIPTVVAVAINPNYAAIIARANRDDLQPKLHFSQQHSQQYDLHTAIFDAENHQNWLLTLMVLA